jgi:predicted dehydrogenase
VKLAVVGAGVIGRMRARSVAANPGCELVAVVDPDDAAARRAADGTRARVLADARALLEGDAVDALIVSTPVHLHEAMVVDALRAGKHVLCEKPLSNGVEPCRRMLEAARASGRTIAVGFNHRFYPSFRFMKHAIEAGEIGRLDEVRAYGAHDGLANFRAEWMYRQPHSGGGAMMDVGIHMTDLARYYAGEVVEVYGMAGENVWHVDGSEDRAVAILKSADGVPIVYQASWNEWKGYRVWMEAYGEKGMVRAQYGPMWNLLITHATPGAGRKRRIKPYLDVALRERLRGWETTTQRSFDDEVADFLRMTRGERVDLADGWSGLRAVEIAHAVVESSRTGAPVRLSPR